MKDKRQYPISTTDNKLILIAIGVAVLFWILEAAIHVFVFHEGSLVTQIFTPGLHEIWMRSLGVFLIIIIFGVYAQFVSRKRAVEALRQSEENLATTLNSIGDAVIATDTEGRVLRINPVAEELTGWKLSEAKTHLLDEVFHIVNEETRKAVESPVAKVLREGIVVGLANHTLLISKDGKERPIDDSGAPIRNARGEITGVVLVFRDVTETREAARRINHLNAVLRAIRNVNQLITKEKDRDRLLKGVCDSLIETRGYHDAWIALFDESMKFVCAAEAGMGEGFSKLLERLKQGELVMCTEKALEQSNVLAIENPLDACGDCPLAENYAGGDAMAIRLEYGNKVYGIMSASVPSGTGTDMEEQALLAEVAGDIAFALHGIEMEAEKKALRAEATLAGHLASLGELAAGVAHEINNPINGIINYAQILVDESEEQGEEAEIPSRIIKEGERIAAIVRNLLSFARDRKEEHSPAQVQDILSDSLALTKAQIRKDGIKLKVDVPADLPRIKARSQEIQQVVLNILSNARHALNQRFAESHDDKVLEIRGELIEIEGRKHLRMTFYDRGTGIPAHILNRICEPFFSAKHRGEGTGLGLSISYGIVKEHGGRLWFDSVEGAYTKVMVDLPVDK